MMNENGFQGENLARDQVNVRGGGQPTSEVTKAGLQNEEIRRKKLVFQKFKRAIRRLVILARAARKHGKFDFSIGGLVLEVSQPVTTNAKKSNEPQAWIEIVISQLNMEELIEDEVLEKLKSRLHQIEMKAKTHASVFNTLKQEIQSLDFGEIFKDAEKLKQIHKIMTDTSYEAKN